MIITAKADGTLIKTVPDRVYQGSNNADTIIVVAPIIQSATMNIRFKLPQINEYTQNFSMTPANASIYADLGVSVWTYSINSALTQYYGTVQAQFAATVNGAVVSSGAFTFEVERGVEVDLPDPADPNYTYDDIYDYLTDMSTRIFVNGDLEAKAILPYDETFTYRLGATIFNSGDFYTSLVNNNLGNALTDTTKWHKTDFYSASEIDVLLNTKQNVIDASHKLNADYVDDTNSTNKFVTTSEKAIWNAKQDLIDSSNKLSSDLVDDTDATNKFVTTSDISTWNAKQNAITNSNKLSADLVDDTGTTNKFVTASEKSQITTNANDIAGIEDLIPSQASSSNQLADKNFVNSSISTNTANFIGTFENVSDLEGYSGTITNNDYAFVINQELDFATTTAMNNYDKTLLTNYDYAWVENGAKYDLYRFDIVEQTWGVRATNISKGDVSLIVAYNRYKYNGTTSEWNWEYTLNTSGFTANQWAAINSGITDADVAQISTNATNIENKVNKTDEFKIEYTHGQYVTLQATETNDITNGSSGIILKNVIDFSPLADPTTQDTEASIKLFGGNIEIIAEGEEGLNDGNVTINGNDIETQNNKVTSLSSSSTDTEYPTAKCVYDAINSAIVTTLNTPV